MKKLFLNVIMVSFICMLAAAALFADGKTAYGKSLTEKKQIILEKGSTLKIKVKEGSNSNYQYTSDDTDIVRVTKAGNLKAKNDGSTTVVVKKKGTKNKSKIKVKVISDCTARTIKKKKSVEIKNIFDGKVSSYKWISRNPKIVTVKNNTTLVGRKKGRTYIEGCKNKGKETRVLLKIIVGTPSKSINHSTELYSLTVGDKKDIAYKVKPSSASYKKVLFVPDKTGIVEFSSSGVMTAVAPGETTVKIKAADGCSETSFKVEVYADLNRTTKYGQIKGTAVNTSCIAWFGVPYAKPPVGELRWRAPQDPDPWNGVLETTAKKTKAAQAVTTEKAEGSEDCLYLNIYSPNTISKDLPVMVYLHGGSNLKGSAGKSFKNFAISANCIVVLVEHRLGAFGWLDLDALKTGNPEEDSGNFALLDIKKSLEWVRDNISAFGGNPNNVTLSGFSAGGRNTLACIISPIMSGLFQKAIVFSGGMTTCKSDEAEQSAEGKLAELLVKRGRFDKKDDAKDWIQDEASKDEIKELLYSLSTDEVASMYTYMGLKISNFPQIFEDGYVIPEGGFDVVSKGNYNKVPMMFGSVTQEFATYSLSSVYFSRTVNYYDSLKKGSNMLAMIQTARKYGSMYQSFYYIENNTVAFTANADQPSIFAYRFNWGNDPAITGDYYANYLGSVHGLDVNFLCGSYKNNFEGTVTNLYTSANAKGRKALTSSMQTYVGNFLKNGSPNGNGLATWNSWTSDAGASRIMILDASEETDLSCVSTQFYTRNYIDSLINANLTKEQHDILYNHVLAGRYFMPVDATTDTPDEESEGNVEDVIDVTDTE